MLGSADRELLNIFEKWTTVRSREHYIRHPDRPSDRGDIGAGAKETR